ncbi:hypothetical protein [Kaistia terrae]|uniref:Peptidase C39 domain-containing protein n=1 Tax=Kaistia terrae TaxID=537017 RepID=A0ABW0Q5L0_9HYPH|nr:hypothetical protein [Kaistia terrae]MCX5581202.1 hypothetical protein [Kaistia terrae]
MAKPVKPLPLYQQGDLDCLCGIYAIVNAVRLCLGPQSALDRTDWQRLFFMLAKQAHKQVGSLSVVTYGIDTRPLWILIKAAVSHMDRRNTVRLTARRPFKNEPDTDPSTVIAWLARHTAKPGTGVIIGLGGEFDHWTTVCAVTGQYVAFYDSARFSRVLIRRCEREEIIEAASIVELRLDLLKKGSSR